MSSASTTNRLPIMVLPSSASMGPAMRSSVLVFA
jgi:hypothetical protein